MKKTFFIILSLLLIAALILPAFTGSSGGESILAVRVQAADYDDGGGSSFLGWVICFGIALLIAFLVTGILKGQLKSVETKTRADSYTGPNALELTHREDLYTHTTRERRYDPVDKDKEK